MEIAFGAADGCLARCHDSAEVFQLAPQVTFCGLKVYPRPTGWAKLWRLKVSRSSSYAFVDKSHEQFYGGSFCGKSGKRKATGNHNSRILTGENGFPVCSAGAVCNPTADQEALILNQEDLLKELAILKAQLKEKKKQLKAQKKALKAQKPKKTKANGCSSSSSSSESSDCDCETVDMKLLRQSRSDSQEVAPVPAVARLEALISLPPVDPTPIKADATVTDQIQAAATTQNRARLSSEMCTLAGAVGLSSISEKDKVGGKIEVCVGGKCKRAGSEQLLASIKEGIGGSECGVEAMGCKCMGKCGMTMNVRVVKEESNPQHHSHVSLGDAPLLLTHHFGLGPPPSGLPSLGSFSPPLLPCLSPST